ncbi:pyridoxamine 5'-phosphate oxidase family protein [Alienimonas chondri]|uniref:Pyridoxamine 5'-phosphate oxidase Alr4036 family FMN-binding domain-containing protein n=1 Tax=Alienimonas chondri TaxID=2681879 RepID=A0ABX1VF13_9PLAN|nr:pyridoxamine 5'-phosphate oxidase family protein [Alienimonas chondri]NNJ26475.1 hypothetical protein [Alienimonas chondri]
MTFPSNRDAPTDDLDAILADLWERLGDGAARSKPAFHLPTLCTVRAGEDRPEPTARTVVLRHAERGGGAANGGEIGCHTDARGAKVAELRANPRAAWVFYDPAARLQVRATGASRVLTDGPVVDAAWEATPPSARRCYLAPLVPGVETDGPEPNVPPAVRKRDPTPEESAPGRANFAVLRTDVDRIDWLHLHHAGHLRAVFERTGDDWRGAWVAV